MLRRRESVLKDGFPDGERAEKRKKTIWAFAKIIERFGRRAYGIAFPVFPLQGESTKTGLSGWGADGERAEKVEKNDIGICLSETIRKKGSRYDEEIDGNICAIYFSG